MGVAWHGVWPRTALDRRTWPVWARLRNIGSTLYPTVLYNQEEALGIRKQGTGKLPTSRMMKDGTPDRLCQVTQDRGPL